jgi:hypothetical protein
LDYKEYTYGIGIILTSNGTPAATSFTLMEYINMELPERDILAESMITLKD